MLSLVGILKILRRWIRILWPEVLLYMERYQTPHTPAQTHPHDPLTPLWGRSSQYFTSGRYFRLLYPGPCVGGFLTSVLSLTAAVHAHHILHYPEYHLFEICRQGPTLGEEGGRRGFFLMFKIEVSEVFSMLGLNCNVFSSSSLSLNFIFQASPSWFILSAISSLYDQVHPLERLRPFKKLPTEE